MQILQFVLCPTFCVLMLVLCEACRDSHDGGTFLPSKVVMNLLILLMMPIELTVLLIKR